MKPAWMALAFIPLFSACSTETGPPDQMPPPDTMDAGSDAPDLPSSECTAKYIDATQVPENDTYKLASYALGYPPVALEGCVMAYIGGPNEGNLEGGLNLIDLGTGVYKVLATVGEEPRRPALSLSGTPTVAFEVTFGGISSVRVYRDGDSRIIAGNYHHAREPRVFGNTVVFTGWLSDDEQGDTDIFVYEAGSGAASAEVLYSAPGQQRFADVSATHVAFADFSEDPDGAFNENSQDLADIVLYDRMSKQSTPRAKSGMQAFPILGAPGFLAYLHWGNTHFEPMSSQYDVFVNKLDGIPSTDQKGASISTKVPYVRPIARGTYLEWVQWPASGNASLWHRVIDLSLPEKQVANADIAELLAPAASDAFTVLASRAGPGNPMQLRSYKRQ